MIILASLFLTGCSGSSERTTSSTARPSAANPSATNAPASVSNDDPADGEDSSSAPTGTPIDVCSILTAPRAAQLSGQAITDASPRTDLGPNEYGCGYLNDNDDTVHVQVTVSAHDSSTNYDAVASGSKNTVAVDGLGDKAFYDNDETLYALAGDHLIQVNGVDGADKCAAMARAVLAAI